MGFDRGRVVQIWSPAMPGHQPSGGSHGGGAGSGYRVGEELVLTAAHVVAGHPIHDAANAVPAAGDGGGIKVAVLGSPEWVPAVVVWRDENADVAVLRAPGLPGVPAGSPAPRWGIVTGREPVECMAVGFPWAAVTPHQLREAEHMVGFIPPISGAVTGAQIITVRSSPPLPRGEGVSPWAGMSGAGVFCGRYLVGVIVVDPARYGTDRLRATPLAPLLESNADLRALLGAPAELAPVRLPPRLAISAKDTMGLRPPYRSLPEDDRAEASAVLLLAKYGLVPFSGRTGQLSELQEWCHQDGTLALRVVTGDGGAGKTRLAAELCTVMAAQGWDTGFAEFNRPGGEVVDDYDRPTLVVVDDAEQQVSLVGQLLESLAYRNAGAMPVRVLLLARNLQVWWEQLNVQTEDLAERRASSVLDLKAGELGPEERAQHYEVSHTIWWQFRDPATAAVSADDGSSPDKTKTDGLPQRPGASVSARGTDAMLDLSDPAFANPLLVHMTALLHVFPAPTGDQPPGLPVDSGGGDVPDRSGASAKKPLRERILRGVLNREKQRWVGVPEGPKFSLMGMQQAVALTTLCAPEDKTVLAQRLVALPDLADAAVGDRRKIADWLHQLYPGPEPPWVVPLRPDLLAEELLAGTEELERIADAVLAQSLQDDDIAVIGQILGELIRASRRDPVREVINHLLEAHLPVILGQALEDSTGQIPALLDRALQVAPQPVQAAEQFYRLPERGIILASLALILAQQSVDHLRAQVVTAPEVFTANLASALNNLSNCLAELGRREEALAAVEEAVRLRRDLVAARPEAFTPALAGALNNLSIDLAELGRAEEALAAVEEATGIYRDLSAASSGAFAPDLAVALNNLSARLVELGRVEEALAAVEEAVRLRRDLVAARPEAFAPDLARALNNLSVDLGELGRAEEALAAIEEATGIYRNLAAARRRIFAPDLAGALNNLSNRLAELGRAEEALAAIEEATRIYRDLAAAHPEAFSPDLARALHTLSNRLAELGRAEEALAAVEEATGIYRDLAAAHPEAFSPALAAALNTLSSRLAELGQVEEALAAIEEAVRLRRDLVTARPEVFTADLAGALGNLSAHLAGLGRREDARAAVEEATGIYRDLAAARPEAFTPALAGALNNLSVDLWGLGRVEEALAAVEEATGIYRGLVAARPEAFTPDLAGALNTLSVDLGELGRVEEALAAVEEATGIYRGLVAARPEAFTPALAGALNNLSVRLVELGRVEEALAVIEEATGIYRDLAAARPGAFAPDLAGAMNNLSVDLAELGRVEEALAAIEEATGIYRDLAAARPEAFTPDLARGLVHMGVHLTELEHPREALNADREALIFYLQLVEGNENYQEETQNAVSNLVIDLRGLGYTDDEIIQELDSLGVKTN